MASSSSSSVILVAGSAALLMAAASAYSFQSKGGGTSSTTTTSRELVEIHDDDPPEEDCITADEVCKIFDRLFLEMQGVLAQLSQHLQELQMQGRMFPQAELRQLLKGEFQRVLQTRQVTIYEEFDVDEECLEEATWEFMNQEDPKVKRAVERFQKLYESVSGESVVGKRPGDDSTAGVAAAQAEILSPEKLVEAAETYFSSLTTTMAEIVNKFKAEGKDLNDKTVAQQLHMQFASVANDAGEEALAKVDISMQSFQDSVQKHASNAEVARTLTMLQMKQQQDLMAMGVPTM